MKLDDIIGPSCMWRYMYVVWSSLQWIMPTWTFFPMWLWRPMLSILGLLWQNLAMRWRVWWRKGSILFYLTLWYINQIYLNVSCTKYLIMNIFFQGCKLRDLVVYLVPMLMLTLISTLICILCILKIRGNFKLVWISISFEKLTRYETWNKLI